MSKAKNSYDWDNPDAWIKIPEFGVRPSEVNFKGFAFPLFHSKANHDLCESLADLIGTARCLAQREFKTLAGLNLSNVAAYDVMFEDQDADPTKEVDITPERLSQAQKVGLLYQFFMLDIERVTCSRTTPSQRLEAMAAAASSVGRWATDGAETALKRLKERNTKNAAAPRPNARTVDHDEVLKDFSKLRREGHTEREARGILVGRQNMGSQSQIYRITKK